MEIKLEIRSKTWPCKQQRLKSKLTAAARSSGGVMTDDYIFKYHSRCFSCELCHLHPPS